MTDAPTTGHCHNENYMKTTHPFVAPVLGSTQSKVNMEAYEQAIDQYNEGNYLGAFYQLLDHLNPEFRTKYGNADGGVPYPARFHPGEHPHRGRQAAYQRRFPGTPRKGTRGHAAPGRRPEHQPADAGAFPQGRRQTDDGIRLPAVAKPSAQTVLHTAQHLPRRRPLRRRVLHEVRRPAQLRTAGDALSGRGGGAHPRSRPADMPRDARRGEGIRDGTQVRLFVERDRHRALQDRLFRAPAGAVAQRPRQGGRRHGQGASRG